MSNLYRVVCTALVLSSFLVIGMVCAKAQSTGDGSGTYAMALRQCGQEWRASEQRKAVTKGEGAKAWNAYRAECVKRVGYVSKRSK